MVGVGLGLEFQAIFGRNESVHGGSRAFPMDLQTKSLGQSVLQHQLRSFLDVPGGMVPR